MVQYFNDIIFFRENMEIFHLFDFLQKIIDVIGLKENRTK